MWESHNYIHISFSDLPRSLFGKSVEERFRSLEKYLERYEIPFENNGETMKIFVHDQFEANQIGTDFRLKSLKGIFDGRSLVINLEKKKPVRQPRLKKENPEEPNEVTSLRDLKAINRKQKTEDGMLLSLLMKRKIITKEELKKWEKDGMFHPFVVGHKKYIPNSEIHTFLHQ